MTDDENRSRVTQGQVREVNPESWTQLNGSLQSDDTCVKNNLQRYNIFVFCIRY